MKHAGGELVVEVHGCGELVAEHSEVYTKVSLDGLFPLDAGVGKAGRLGAAGDGLGAVSAGTEGVVVAAVCVNRIGEVTDGVVTVDTPGATQFEGRYPVLSLEEGFVLDVPANGNRRECTPLVVRAEAAGCITADGGFCHVALVVVPGDTAEVGHEAVRN